MHNINYAINTAVVYSHACTLATYSSNMVGSAVPGST